MSADTDIRVPKKKELDEKVSTRSIIKEVSSHTGVNYQRTADVVYAFLHYIKYSVLAGEKKVVIRNFGNLYPSRLKGRIYGKHVDAPTYHPDRVKLGLTTPLMEVAKWKNMQSIQQAVVCALDAKLKPHGMDLSICARIADLVLSNKPVKSTSGKERVTFIREWIQALGASPLLPATTSRLDPEGNSFNVVKFRLGGDNRQAVIFDVTPDILYVKACIKNKKDILFFADGWASAADARVMYANEETRPLPILITPYGATPEENCRQLYLAYKAARYGDQSKKTK